MNSKNRWFDPKRDWELVKTVLIALVLAVSFRSLAYEPFHIPSGSMKSTLLIGDYIWVSKHSYGYSRYSFPFAPKLFEGRVLETKPKRGEVAVFRPPSRPNTDFIKRIVGLPGDRIQMIDGVLYINDTAVPKEYVDMFTDKDAGQTPRLIKRYRETLPNGVTYYVLDSTQGPLDTTPVYTVPEGHYFMMGDNRDHSTDSRVLSEVGYIPFENLVGRAQAVAFSTDKTAALWEPWKWVESMRFERFFSGI